MIPPPTSATPPMPNTTDNVRALLGAIVRSKPASAKGNYVRSLALSSTMGPGVRVDTGQAAAKALAAAA